MRTKKVLIALSSFAEYGSQPLDLLTESGLDVVMNQSGQRLKENEIIALGAGCAGIVAGVEPYTAHVLSQLSQLKCISRCGVGTDNIDKAKAKEFGVIVANTPDPVIVPVAELTIGMMLDLMRHITWHTNRLRAHRWEKKGGRNLQGSCVGLIGLGRIGKKVAELLKSFEVRVIGFDLYPDHSWALKAGVELVSLDEVLHRSDVVSLHLSVGQDSSFIMDEKNLRSMKKGSMLINLSRGEFIDEDALFSVLSDGHLAGAACDVFSKEPYSGKLCDLENVLLTPHVATLTRESRLEMEKQAVQNLIKVLS